MNIFLLLLVIEICRAGNPVDIRESMKCGECLYYGYNICINDKDHRILTDGQGYDHGNSGYNMCYSQNTLDTKYTHPTWTCSNAYNNTLYANYLCP